MNQARLQEITERLNLNFEIPSVRLELARYYKDDVHFLLSSLENLQGQNRSINTEKCQNFQKELSEVLSRYNFCEMPSA
jgi:hypothetical protein